jgi:hypothetical protein
MGEDRLTTARVKIYQTAELIVLVTPMPEALGQWEARH